MSHTDHRQFGASLDVGIDLPLAAAPSRGMARVVDIVLLSVFQAFVVTVLLLVVAGAALAAGDALDGPYIGILAGLALLVLFVLQWFFLTGLELYTRGQTPGKKLMGLRVVRDDGGALTLVPALLRNLLRLDTIPGAVVLDLALMLWGSSGKRLGDIVAGTVVIEEIASGQARSWPPALAAAEVNLLETWFARVPDLDADRREPIAARLVDRLDAAHPGLLQRNASAVVTLEALAPRATA